MCCPFHQEETPSFVIYPEPESRWFCYSGICYDGGDLIELIRRLEFPHLPVKEAYKQAFAFVGIQPPLEEIPRQKMLTRLGRVLTKEQKLGLDFVSHYYHLALLENEPALKYLEGRGVSLDLIKKLWIGWCDGKEPEVLMAAITSQLGSDYLTALFEEGILCRPDSNDDYKKDMIYERMRGRITFPEKRMNGLGPGEGSVIWMQGRLPHDKSKENRYLNLPGAKVYFGIDGAKNAKKVVLTEGVFDFLPLVGAGVAAIALLNTHLMPEAVPFFREKEVVICLDNDPAGKKGAQEIKEQLDGIAKARVVFPPPGEKDIADWVKTWGLPDVLEALA